MRSIFKYQIRRLSDVVIVKMLKGAKVISVAEQGGILCLWAEVDVSEPMEERVFRIAGTGHNLGGDEGRYIGSVVCSGGALVWHVYEQRSHEE